MTARILFLGLYCVLHKNTRLSPFTFRLRTQPSILAATTKALKTFQTYNTESRFFVNVYDIWCFLHSLFITQQMFFGLCYLFFSIDELWYKIGLKISSDNCQQQKHNSSVTTPQKNYTHSITRVSLAPSATFSPREATTYCASLPILASSLSTLSLLFMMIVLLMIISRKTVWRK